MDIFGLLILFFVVWFKSVIITDEFGGEVFFGEFEFFEILRGVGGNFDKWVNFFCVRGGFLVIFESFIGL